MAAIGLSDPRYSDPSSGVPLQAKQKRYRSYVAPPDSENGFRAGTYPNEPFTRMSKQYNTLHAPGGGLDPHFPTPERGRERRARHGESQRQRKGQPRQRYRGMVDAAGSSTGSSRASGGSKGFDGDVPQAIGDEFEDRPRRKVRGSRDR